MLLEPEIKIKEEPIEFEEANEDIDSIIPTDLLKMEPDESFQITQEELERAISKQLNPYEEQQKLLEIASFEPLKLLPPKKTKRARDDDDEDYTPQRAHAGRLECDLCGKKFSYYRSFRQHRIDHQFSNHDVQCGICHKMVKPAALDYHMNYKHTEERKFQCKLCGRRFKSPGAMRHHETTQHSDLDAYKYECKECQRFFENMDFLDAHIKKFHCKLKDQIKAHSKKSTKGL